MLLFDVRALQDPRPTGVHAVTRALARATARLAPGEVRAVANAARGAGRVAEALGPEVPLVLRRFPNKLVHAGMRFSGRPTLEALAGLRGPATVVASPHFLALRPDSTLVLIIHDLSYFREPQFFSRWMRLWHRAVDFPRLIARADRVVVFSEHVRRDLHDLFRLPTDKVVRLVPGLDAEHFVPPAAAARDAARARHGLPKDYLLMLGADPRKNVRAALLGLKRSGLSWTLAVAGAVDAAPVRADIRRLGMGGRAVALGYLPPQERTALLAGARALVYPSWYEGFGLPPLEALALGVPVVVAQGSAVGEVVGDAGLLVDPRDESSLAAAYRALAADPAAAAARTARARARLAAFRWESAADALVRVCAQARHAPLRSRAGVVQWRHAHRD